MKRQQKYHFLETTARKGGLTGSRVTRSTGDGQQKPEAAGRPYWKRSREKVLREKDTKTLLEQSASIPRPAQTLPASHQRRKQRIPPASKSQRHCHLNPSTTSFQLKHLEVQIAGLESLEQYGEQCDNPEGTESCQKS